MRTRWYPVALVGILAAAGCGTARINMYSGPDLPQEQLAILEHTVAGDDVFSISRIDGKAHRTTMARIEQYILKPGQHEIVFIFQTKGYFSKFVPFKATFNAQPGRKYVAMGRQSGDTILGWVEELKADGRWEKVADAEILSQ
jgi:hypothetical protein